MVRIGSHRLAIVVVLLLVSSSVVSAWWYCTVKAVTAISQGEFGTAVTVAIVIIMALGIATMVILEILATELVNIAGRINHLTHRVHQGLPALLEVVKTALQEDSKTKKGKEAVKIATLDIFQDETKQTGCKECEVGLYSQSGWETCKSCSHGQFQDEKAKSACKNCAAGMHQDEEMQTSCKDCAIGMYSTGAVKDCTNCEVGRFQELVGKAACDNCIKGQFQGC